MAALTITTDAPCTYQVREVLIGDNLTFDPAQSSVVDSAPPLKLRSGQTFDYDNPLSGTSTPDENYSIYCLQFNADASGATTHVIPTDAGVTRFVFETTSRVRSTTVPTVRAGDSLYVWCSDGTRFPD